MLDRNPTEHLIITDPSQLPTDPGTYGLVLRLPSDVSLQVGRLGVLAFPTGLYLYIGSALGAGGIQARVQRHLANQEHGTRHWHIDWLLHVTSPHEVWSCAHNDRLECKWAHSLQMSGVTSFDAFGASDCNCSSHLFYFADQVVSPQLEALYCPSPSKKPTRFVFNNLPD